MPLRERAKKFKIKTKLQTKIIWTGYSQTLAFFEQQRNSENGNRKPRISFDVKVSLTEGK